ncbi:MAG: GGDEF domain-containing protein [Deltaproteobacteria bacterium]|nr:GGDEF domain-containing protein [Deltaproteobacteria bacterium]
MSTEDKTVIADIGSIDIQQSSQKNTDPCLVQYNGETLGKRYVLKGSPLKVGRSVDADVTIAESSVSRVHAVLKKEQDQIILEDAGSANGTYVNDVRVSSPVLLNDQDMVRLGAVILKFFSGDNIDGYIQDKIYQMATIDAGTELYNKQALLTALETEFYSSKQSGRPLSLIYYDLDHFKQVNDRYGHNAGDQVLRESARLTRSLLRKGDIPGRVGGEEFVIILPDTQKEKAAEIAERIRSTMEKHLFHLEIYDDKGKKQNIQHTQTVSLGTSQIHPTIQSPKELLENADKKLYTSKQSGRNRVTS